MLFSSPPGRLPTRLSAALLALLAVAAARPVAAATLRPVTTLTAAVVRLSDLFDDAGEQAQRVLGPGPAPGTRLVVEAPQLAAIARQFGVDWKPNSPSDRVLLDRPGRTLPRQDVIEALRVSLEGAGYSADCDIDLPGFNPPIVAAEVKAQVTVEQFDQDPDGHFTAVVGVFSDGLPPTRMRVVGRAQETVEVPVATRRMLPGTLLRPEDVRMARMRTGLIQTDVARAPDEAVGHVVRHLSMPGQAFPLADLARPAVVMRNQRITLSLQSDGIEVSAQGIATEPGGIGDQISVRNAISGAILQAEVTGPAAARVAPGAVPLGPTQRANPPIVAIR
jgi:flagella basal body P-ring formation protein FlgA